MSQRLKQITYSEWMSNHALTKIKILIIPFVSVDCSWHSFHILFLFAAYLWSLAKQIVQELWSFSFFIIKKKFIETNRKTKRISLKTMLWCREYWAAVLHWKSSNSNVKNIWYDEDSQRLHWFNHCGDAMQPMSIHCQLQHGKFIKCHYPVHRHRKYSVYMK